MAGVAFGLGADDGADRPEPEPPSKPTVARCLEVIPDSVFATLGWPSESTAVEHAGRCQRTSEDGTATVGAVPVVAPGDESSAAAEREYDERCARLTRRRGPAPYLDPAWLPAGTTACARLLPRSSRGVAEMFLLTDDDEVVQIRLATPRGVGDAAVRLGLTELAAAAEEWW